MRLAAIATIAVLLSGCVGEFLGPPTTTARTIACAVLEGGPVIIEHHGEVPAGGNEAVAAWFAVMADATGTSVERFSDRVGSPIGGDAWLQELEVLGSQTVLHVLWDERAADTMDIPAPGVLRINVTALEVAAAAGHDPITVAKGFLLHGLGHVLGTVNMGIPRYNQHAPENETAGHHEAGGVMTGRWHDLDDLPASAQRYPDSVVRDWQNAAADRRICP